MVSSGKRRLDDGLGSRRSPVRALRERPEAAEASVPPEREPEDRPVPGAEVNLSAAFLDQLPHPGRLLLKDGFGDLGQRGEGRRRGRLELEGTACVAPRVGQAIDFVDEGGAGGPLGTPLLHK